jgi:hypothetical protein
MTAVSSSSESTGPLPASSSSRGALASIAASVPVVSVGFSRHGKKTYSAAWLDSSSGTLQEACRTVMNVLQLRVWRPWNGSCKSEIEHKEHRLL